MLRTICVFVAFLLCCPLTLAQGLNEAVVDQSGNLEVWSSAADATDDVPCASWINPTVRPWAALLCVHGLSLHATSYDDFGKAMADMGVPTYAVDVRGFGSWQNNQAKENRRVNFTEALNDIHRVAESLRAAHPDLPIVLVGESMGGAIALQAAAQNESLIDGLICSVPASRRTNQKMNTVKVAIGLLTSPNKQFNAGKSVVHAATTSSHDKSDVNEELLALWSEDDKLTRMNLSARELAGFAHFTAKNNSQAELIKNVPVLFLQGANDNLIKPKGTVELFQKLATKNKSLYMVNSQHLILEHNQFTSGLLDHICGWLAKNAVPMAASRVNKLDAAIAPAALKQAEGHLKIAQGYLLLGDNKAAQDQLLQTIESAKGSTLAQEAESLLYTLPEDEIAPSAKEQAQLSAEDMHFITHEQALANDKPSVILFYADWIVGSKQAEEVIENELHKFAGKVNFVRIDADAQGSLPILKRYAIRPIPCLIYLSTDNKVLGYTIGHPGRDAIDARIRKLIGGAQQLNPLPNSGR